MGLSKIWCWNMHRTEHISQTYHSKIVIIFEFSELPGTVGVPGICFNQVHKIQSHRHNCHEARSLLYPQIPRSRTLPMEGHVGRHHGWSGGRGSEGIHGHEPLLWFPWKRTGEAGWAASGLASLSYFRGHWGIVSPVVLGEQRPRVEAWTG